MVKAVLAAVDLPLVIWGCDVPAKDQLVMPKVAEAAQGENCLLGAATETDYRTLTAAAQAYGHKLIAASPCDINKAKQVNILVSDMGFPHGRRGHLSQHGGAGLRDGIHLLDPGARAAGGPRGDRLMAQPVILDVGYEAWRVKEARSGDELAPLWGPLSYRGPAWEAVTASNLLQGGADLLVMRHPQAVEAVRGAINQLVEGEAPMIIFSERINGMYRDVRAAIGERNKTVIQDLLRPQVEGGADVIDVNVGPSKGDPVENFVWLAQTVHEVTPKPISLDSAKADLLVQVLPKVGKPCRTRSW